MEAQWFLASGEVQDTEVIKRVVGVSLQGQRCNLPADCLEKGATITAKHYVALLYKLKQQLSPNIEASF
jgi:hypothetical protein